MTARATGTFEVDLTPVDSAEEDGVTRGRFSMEKRFEGDLEGTSRGEMLTARTPVESSAGYVALERVTGTLDGRRGSFVLQHSGTMDRGEQRLSVTVVPDSGTAGLEGIAGSMTITIEDGTHRYELAYDLPDG